MMGTLVDNLSYSYSNGGNSNKLLKVEDTGGQDADPRWQTFKQKNGSAAVDYTYDNAGNMLTDHNKGLNSSIIYNFLNLPSSVPDKNVLNYYTASGTKVRSKLPEGNFDYLGPVVYKNGKIDFISTPEGRVLRPGTVQQDRSYDPNATDTTNLFWRYEYHLKDHLGNLRVACRCAEKAEPKQDSRKDGYPPYIVQQLMYDAWGVKIPFFNPDRQIGSPEHRNKYNGKEYLSDLGWYEYGFRIYDPVIGRFNQVDPLAEKYPSLSPYAYVANNPLIFVDPDGKDIIFWMYSKKNGKYTARQTNFDQLGKREQHLVQQLAMNKDGASFLNQFVNGKKELGAATLQGNSKENFHILFSAGKIKKKKDGSFGVVSGETGKKIDKELTVEVDVANQSEEEAAITLGHEVFLHAIDYGTENDKSTHEDHKGWDKGTSENGKKFNSYINYLKGWYGTLKFDKAEEDKRKSNHENVLLGN